MEFVKISMKKKAIIISVKGTSLSNKEKYILSKKSMGINLFKRNIKSLKQVKSLTNNIRKLTKNRNFPILIDEEGSTVSRLIDIIITILMQIYLEIYIKLIKML